MSTKETVRVSFDVEPELHTRFANCIKYGNKSDLLRKVFELTVEKIEQGGYFMVGAIMAGDFNPLFEKEEKDGEAD